MSETNQNSILPDPIIRLRRFLWTGQETACYSAWGTRESHKFNKNKLPCVEQLIAENRGRDIVREVLNVAKSAGGAVNYYNCDALVFVLAVCARSSGLAKIAAYEAVQEICSTSELLFKFIRYSKDLCSPKSSGWGRALRGAVQDWYSKDSANKLAEECTRYISRKGWHHVDLIRLAHVKPGKDATAVVLKYLCKGLEGAEKEATTLGEGDEARAAQANEVLDYLKAVHKLKHTSDDQEAAFLIRQHGLHLEHVPTPLLRSPEVWLALLPQLPIRNILCHLGRLAKCGHLNATSPVQPLLLEALRDNARLQASGLQPADCLLVTRRGGGISADGGGAGGGGGSGSGGQGHGHPPRAMAATLGGTQIGKRRLTTSVAEALRALALSSLVNVPSTGKRILITLDVRNPMAHGRVWGWPTLTPALASALLVSTLRNAEGEKLTVAAFSMRDIALIQLQDGINMAEIARRMRETPMGPVNCAKPMQWAQERNEAYDAFIICTDNQVKPTDVDPSVALQQYRTAMNLPNAKLIVLALTTRRFSLSPAHDLNMLDIAGFDPNVPRIIHQFLSADIANN